MLKSSKIYVAGHTGLLGSALLKKLTKNGYKNIIVRAHRELELKDWALVNDFFAKERPEIVFMAAGRAGNLNRCITHPATLYSENSLIQNNIFAAASQYEVEYIVYFGSSCIYPNDAIQPISEETFLNGPLEEATEGYAAAKMSGVMACRAYNSQYYNGACRFIALIPNTLYGPNDHFSLEHSHVFSALIMRFHEAVEKGLDEVTLWGSGKPRREFIFSEDIANAAIFALKNAGKLENTHYNVGTGVDTSIRDLASMIARKVGFQGEIKWDLTKHDGRQKKLLDSAKIKQLGWNSSVSLENGFESTYKWYLQNIEKMSKSGD